MTDINQRLNELNITVPEAAAPVANYLAAIVVDDTLYISGQLPMENGALKYKGQAGSEVELADAKRAAELCAINVIAQIKAACGADFGKFAQLIRVGVFVNAGAEFEEHASVANGASDLLANVFGEQGKHIRAAVGCASLPLGATVEVEATVKLKS